MTDVEAHELEQHSSRVANPSKRGHINIDTLSHHFQSGETVTPDKALTVDADDFSIEAEKMILLTGGHVICSDAPPKKKKVDLFFTKNS